MNANNISILDSAIATFNQLVYAKEGVEAALTVLMDEHNDHVLQVRDKMNTMGINDDIPGILVSEMSSYDLAVVELSLPDEESVFYIVSRKAARYLAEILMQLANVGDMGDVTQYLN